MRIKDVKKLLVIGDTTMGDEMKEKLKQIGFSQLPEALKSFGVLIWDTDDYEVYIEYWNGDRRYNEGAEKTMEIIGEGFYGEVYRIVPLSLYVVHLSTGGFEGYYSVQAVDKGRLEEVGFLRITEGYIYCGNQDDVSEAVSKLVRITPVVIKVY
jgi:hypothetical protein